jgi:hypothetical protein
MQGFLTLWMHDLKTTTMPRDYRDRSGRMLTRDQRKELRKRAKAIRKSQKREMTRGEIVQYSIVVAIIIGILVVAWVLTRES